MAAFQRIHAVLIPSKTGLAGKQFVTAAKEAQKEVLIPSKTGLAGKLKRIPKLLKNPVLIPSKTGLAGKHGHGAHVAPGPCLNPLENGAGRKTDFQYEVGKTYES